MQQLEQTIASTRTEELRVDTLIALDDAELASVCGGYSAGPNDSWATYGPNDSW